MAVERSTKASKRRWKSRERDSIVMCSSVCVLCPVREENRAAVWI